jgi:hypothetical protein
MSRSRRYDPDEDEPSRARKDARREARKRKRERDSSTDDEE